MSIFIYENRDHRIWNVKVKEVTGPVKWKSQRASSDPFYFSSTTDTSGNITPRVLKTADFSGGAEHILAYDISTGKVIDCYSSLNLYYAAGYEMPPVVSFY